MSNPNRVDSTAQGNALEDAIFRLFKSLIDRGDFYFPAECSKIFKRKGYFSRDRQKDIIFDIAIEVYMPGQETYSILALIECKNYNHPVPVDDAEEFFSKIQQVSGANVKGIIAATASFQPGTTTFSQSKGIGLLRYYNREEFKWVLNRSPSTLISSPVALGETGTAYIGITSESYRSSYFDCYCCAGGEYTNSLNAFVGKLAWQGIDHEQRKKLAQVVNVGSGKQRLVRYREKEDIERLCEATIRDIGYVRGEVSLSDICTRQSESNGLQIKRVISRPRDVSGSQILGSITFNPLEITLFADTAIRQKFTLAHELGHLLLGHSEYMTGEYCQQEDFELDHRPDLKLKDIVRMEWQANYCASCLLLPRKVFLPDFLVLAAEHGLRNRGFGILYVDDQACNQANYYRITDCLKTEYNVSRSVVRIRLEKMGLLNDQRKKREPRE